MVDINDTVSLSAVATLDPHTPHDVTVSLGATARTFFSYGDHRDFPDNKFVYELDGTVVKYLRSPNSGDGNPLGWVEYAMTDAEVRALNNWGVGRYPHDNAYESYQYRFIFPELRDVKAAMLGTRIYGGVGGNPYWRLYWSANTTTGEDGTWTQVGVNSTYHLTELTYPQLRTAAYSNILNLSGVRGIRVFVDHTLSMWFDEGGRPHMVHLYGNKAQVSSRLAFWHPTLDQEVTGNWFDWANFPYGEETVQFRVKNLSPIERALDITVSMDTTNDQWSPAINTYHSLYDGATWGSSVSVDVLASNAISSVYTLKRDFPPGSPSQWFTMRLKAVAGQWVTYVHNVSGSFSSYASADGGPMRERNATVSLISGTTLTDGTLYRSSKTYRSLISYRGGRTTQVHTAAGTFTASGSTGDLYVSEYKDVYGSAGLEAGATQFFWITVSATVTAGPNGDNFSDSYTDAYGNAGLYAVATVT